jgi:hypothetical protein
MDDINLKYYKEYCKILATVITEAKRSKYRMITKEMTEIKHVLLSHGVT